MIKLLIVLVFVFLGFKVVTAPTQADIDNNRAYVLALCNWSHTHNDGSLEQRCGEAQDKTHTEYLCVTRSSDLNCWVEQK